eukprot:426423_1
MQVTFVLDCSNCMLDYVKHFKNQVLKLFQEQAIKMEIAFVIYSAKNDQKKGAKTQSATHIKTYPFKPNGTYNSDIIPSRAATHGKTSLQPINVHRALFDALAFKWNSSAKKRILILIAKNPPHGIRYHELGRAADSYPKGIPHLENTDILKAIANQKIHLFVVNINNQLKHFCNILMNSNTDSQNAIAHEWVRCVVVESKNDLTNKLLECVTRDQDESKVRVGRVSSIRLTQSNKDLSINKKKRKNDIYEDDNLVGKMRWAKERNERYPVLILSVDVQKATSLIWDGASTRHVALADLYQRIDLMRMQEDNSVRKSYNAVHLLLERSLERQQMLQVECDQCKAQCKKYQSVAKDIEKMIHRKIKTHDSLKWIRKDGKYQPVLVLQHEDPRYPDSKRSWVLDTTNRTLRVKRTSLFNTPPCESPHHIAKYVEQLDILCADYPWKYAVECGITQCSFEVDVKGFLVDSKKTETGIILGVDAISKCGEYTRYHVRRHDTGKIVPLWDDKFKILGPDDKRTQLKHLQASNSELKSQNETLTSKNKQLISDIDDWRVEIETSKVKANSLQTFIERLKSDNDRLKSNNDRLQSDVNKSKKDMEHQSTQINELKTKYSKSKLTTITNENDDLKQKCSQLKSENTRLKSDKVRLESEKSRFQSDNADLQSDNDQLQSKKRELKNKFDRQSAQIQELTMKNQKVIALKDKFEKQASDLKQKSNQLEQQNKEQRELINELRDRLSEDSIALDLSRGFPPVQDIVNEFGTLKSHYHVEAA